MKSAMQIRASSGRRLRAACVICCALLLAGWNAGAQGASAAPAHDLSLDHSRTVWRTGEGLPENIVQAVSLRGEGQMWIGTSGGLVSFDGAHVQTVDGNSGKRLPGGSVFALSQGHDGSLWVGTEGAGLFHRESFGWRTYTRADGLDNMFVRAVLEDSQQRLWVGTDEGLYLREGQRFRRVQPVRDADPFAVHALLEDSDHRIWAGGSQLFSLGLDGTWRAYPLAGAYSMTRVKALLQDAYGSVYAGTVAGLQRLESDHFVVVPGLHATVRCLKLRADGTLWVGTIGAGLWRYRGGRLEPVDTAGMLPSSTVLALAEDAYGQLWLGTQSGLVRLSQTPMQLTRLPNAGDPDFETIADNGGGSFWVAAQQLYRVDNGQAQPVRLPGLGTASVRNVFRASNGSLWVGTDGSGAFRIDGKHVQHFVAPRDLTNNFIRAFLQTRNGAIWIATDEGVTRVDGSGEHKFSEADGLAYFSTRCLLEDSEGSVWVGTDRGVSLWRQGRFVSTSVTAALQEEQVWSMLQDRSGVLWFGTRDHGLYRLERDKLDHFSRSEGVPSNGIYGLNQDRSGRIWMTGPNTVASLAPAEARSASQRLNFTEYTLPYAARRAQFYGGRQPSSYAAADGSMWFPSSSGLAHLSPAIVRPAVFARAQLDAIVADGLRMQCPAYLELPAATHRLSIRFSAASLQDLRNVHFRWKLDGFDKDWIEAGPNRTATYTNLPAGRYRFRLALYDSDQPSQTNEISLSLWKRPVFYQTWTFLSLSALLIVGLAACLYRARVGRVERGFAAVLAERERVAREMHDTVIQGCTGLSALLEAFASRNPRLTGLDAELLKQAREQSSRTVDEARGAIWALRHPAMEQVDLVEALRAIAKQTVQNGSSTVRVQHNVSHCELPAGPANEIVMAIREALCNALRHSGSETVTLDLRRQAHALTLSVQDFGCGLRQGQQPPEMHFGIAGMRERVQRLGGELSIDGVPGRGTTVTLQLALRGGKLEDLPTC